ncbi:MAG: hypothetical protein OQK32_08785 [Gammaproteobacteria bacterium]|nr:hypothetical protein [Gammaproteobacteria bacterium]MCW8922934.1 hypothetical protein [Gammaproteobacteria bacterium]
MKLKEFLALIVIFGILIIVAVSVNRSSDSTLYTGPSVLSSDNKKNIYINVGFTIYQLDSKGRLVDEVTLEQLGLSNDLITDIQVLSSGELIVVLARPGRVFRCSHDSRKCNQINFKSVELSGLVKVFPDEENNRIYISDGEGHRILVYDIKGERQLDKTEGSDGLRYPNNLFINNNELIVSDTNHHRIVALDPNNVDQVIWEASVKNEIGSSRRKWPTNVVKTLDGKLWVINDNSELKYGDVILMDLNRRPYKRVALELEWDPIKMLARENDVLIASAENFDLISVDFDGDTIEVFGNKAFRDVLAQAHNNSKKYHQWYDVWVWVLLVPLFLLGVVAAVLDANSKKIPKSEKTKYHGLHTLKVIPFDGQDVYWVSINDKFKDQMNRQIKNIKWSAILLILTTVLLLIVDFVSEESLYEIVVLMGSVMLFMLPLVWMLHYHMKALLTCKVGITTNGEIMLESNGVLGKHAVEDVFFTDNAIVSGVNYVMIKTTFTVFEEEKMNNFIKPMLLEGNKLVGFALLNKAIKTGRLHAVMPYLLLIYMFMLLVIVSQI